jgi:hypothetical protein
MCLNDLDNEGKPYKLSIYGEDDSELHRRIDLNYFPCVPIQLTAYNKSRQDTECIVDLKSESAMKRKLK